MKKRTALAVAASSALLVSGAALAFTSVKPYAVGIADGYTTKALWSVGDRVPETSDPSKQYQMVGIPDGLGGYRKDDNTSILYMNHELISAARSEPVVGGPLNRGAIVSKLTLDRGTGKVLTAERAYDTVYQENTLIGPAPDVTNTTRGFARFCSASLAGEKEGFDRPIYFANEEDGNPATTFDGKGGQAVAIFDNKAYALPKLGRFAWENTLVQRRSDEKTVIFGMEDGPSALDPAVENSQLYLYIGKKDRAASSPLAKNGLDNGVLYVAVAENAALTGEEDFASGNVMIKWVPIPNAGDMTSAQLEAATDAVGGLRFARPEDGAFNTKNRNQFFFVTTGGAAGANVLGRLYSVELDRKHPTRPATLSVVYNADSVIAAGGDTAISPDNLDISDKYLMINEDGTAESRPVMASKRRDGSIWRFNIDRRGVDVWSALRVAELRPPGRDGVAVGPGVWETSGIIDAKGLVKGDDAWLFDVQAHGPTAAPVPNTVEDGQLLLMTKGS